MAMNFEFFRASQRHRLPIAPAWWAALVLVLAGSWLLAMWRPVAEQRIASLTPPPTADQVRRAALGDVLPLAKWLNLYVQTDDTQPGVSIPFGELDYPRITQWLDRIVMLDPQSHYALMVASHVYFNVKDSERQRVMLDFIARSFEQDPEHRWQWMAHAVIQAKHHLKDLPLALQLARRLRETLLATPGIPTWVKQLESIVLEAMDDKQAAALSLGLLIDNGHIDNPQEIEFLLRSQQQLLQH
jgi:hypothetical protein